ncbi:flavin reductase family protein [Streptomyces sp. MB09-01]|uniref:flavin reductase family protein n=1 Tax=Streptomyces sp. MB09-01 TaxID=3028666 RepID=UPI0029A62013|nr:flavin reductase family protein [Streptomyces sp. MB09-01]MDX3535886.1 flavin reductase family protein [Streptomyces sp. MB09-01]
MTAPSDSVPTVHPEVVRQAARTCATGVAVLTTRLHDELFAKTVSSFVTLSMDPPLISVAVTRHSPLVRAVEDSGRLAVSVLRVGQEHLSRRFATPGAGRATGSFAGVTTRTEATGSPVLEDCLSWFDCRLHSVLPGGDHSILVGRPVAAAGSQGEPLLYREGGYHALATPTATTPPRPDRAPTAPGVRT